MLYNIPIFILSLQPTTVSIPIIWATKFFVWSHLLLVRLLFVLLFNCVTSLAVESISTHIFLVYLGCSVFLSSLSLLRWRCFRFVGYFFSSPLFYFCHFCLSRSDECRLSLFGIFPSQFRGWCVLVIDIVSSCLSSYYNYCEQLQLQVQG